MQNEVNPQAMVRQITITLESGGRIGLTVSPTIPPDLLLSVLHVVQAMVVNQIMQAHLSTILPAGGKVVRVD